MEKFSNDSIDIMLSISKQINEAYLSEERHVYMQCEDAIKKLFIIIYERYTKNIIGEFETELYYEPFTRTCNTDNQGYPIYVKCIHDRNNIGTKMSVNDHNDNPEEILIVVNFDAFQYIFDSWDAYAKQFPDYEKRQEQMNNALKRLFRSTLKHEFGHIRQNYSIHTGHQPITDNRKFVSDNIDKTLFPTVNPSYYNKVEMFMYLFSPVEQQQRCAELYEYVNNMTPEEIFGNNIENSHKGSSYDLHQVIVNTENIHLRNEMKDCIDFAYDMKLNPGTQRMLILIAFYFKYYNLYKTVDKIDKNFIEKVFSGKADTFDVDLYCEHFLPWLDSELLKYTKKIFNVVHYNLYKRFWELEDVQHYGVDFGERISEGLIEELNELYGDEKIPLLNKPIE